MTNELKPTNKEIAEYLLAWIESLDGDGLIDVDTDLEHIMDLGKNFRRLRKMFEAEDEK